jgi:hypothetical protein
MAKSKTGSTTTTFEKMGDDFGAHVMNLSGAPSPYTQKTATRPGKKVQPSGKASTRGSSMINEANGPACTIKATLYAANAAAAGEQTRNVRILPSAIGFDPRAYNSAA